jgi:hypothetical protein
MHDICSVIQEDAAEFAPEDRGLANIFMLAIQCGKSIKNLTYTVSRG